MLRVRSACLLLAVVLSGCASNLRVPSLAPRAAERIDPRVPVADNSQSLPADPAFVAQLQGLRDRALAAAQAAEPAIVAAQAAAGSAGARGSESWIEAQEMLSAAVAARAPFTAALGDLDRLIAERVRSGGRMVPQDVAAGRRIADELAAVDRRQGEALTSLERRLR